LTIAATLVLCICLMSGGSGNCIGTPSSPGLVDYNAAACSFIFAYAGQSIMLEMQAEMKQPNDFPKAVGFSFSTLLVAYILVTVISYWQCGASTPD